VTEMVKLRPLCLWLDWLQSVCLWRFMLARVSAEDRIQFERHLGIATAHVLGVYDLESGTWGDP